MSATAPVEGDSGTRAPRGYSEEITKRAETYVAQGMRRRDARRLAQRELADLEIGGPNPFVSQGRKQIGYSDATGITATWRAGR